MALPAAPPAESGRTPDAATAYGQPVLTYAHASEAPREAAPQEVVPQAAHPATEANEATAPEVPTSRAETDRDEPAPPTVPVPVLAPEPPARPLGIRYAANGVPGMAGNPQPAKPAASPTAASPTAEAAAASQDYWDAEEEGQFAGLVYPARGEHRAAPDDAAEGDADDADETEAEGSAPRKTSPELDDDAPPFATAPFASVPRLNRVRSMPTPPDDEDE